MAKDNSRALVEQEELLQAIHDDTVIVEIRSSSPLGASILAFNQIAEKHGRQPMTPQEWGELAIPAGLLTYKRSWEQTAKTRNNEAFVKEMKSIAVLFTLPEATHPKYMERMIARFEAEQNCRTKYGVQ